MKALVRVLFGRRCSNLLFECRRCGTTVASEQRACPECGSDSIATYEIS